MYIENIRELRMVSYIQSGEIYIGLDWLIEMSVRQR